MCILSESVVAIDADSKWMRNVFADLVLLLVGAFCFIVSFNSFLGYACVLPLVTGCFLMCFAACDFLMSAFGVHPFKFFKKNKEFGSV